jgi:hypothetical protein
VIFNGSRPNDVETLPDGRVVSKHAIYIWDVKSGSVTKYADAERASLCYADGYISYSRKEASQTVHIAGPFGKEIVTPRLEEKEPSNSKSAEMVWVNRFTCKPYRQSEISPLPGTRIPLKTGHGFLYLGVRDPREERYKRIVYYPGGERAGVELPIERWQVISSGVTATHFNNSYLLAGDQISNSSDSCVPKGFSRRVYRLSLNGVVETISLPARGELRCYVGAGSVREVRAGMTVYVHTGLLRNSRLYFIDQGALAELARGWLPVVQVSPDGCRIAAGISSDDDPLKPTSPLYRGHLKVIEFCAGRTK